MPSPHAELPTCPPPTSDLKPRTLQNSTRCFTEKKTENPPPCQPMARLELPMTEDSSPQKNSPKWFVSPPFETQGSSKTQRPNISRTSGLLSPAWLSPTSWELAAKMWYKSQASRWSSWSLGDNTCLTHMKDMRFQINATHVNASVVEVAVIRRRCTLQHATPPVNRVAAPDSVRAGGR